MSLQQSGPWALFILFVAIAVYFSSSESLFISQSAYPEGKTITWFLFFVFLAYTYYCSMKENIFTTVKTIFPLHWARQIGLDLYIGLAIFLFIIYLNEGSLLVVALWAIPIILFANLATLLYLALNYDAIISRFL